MVIGTYDAEHRIKSNFLANCIRIENNGQFRTLKISFQTQVETSWMQQFMFLVAGLVSSFFFFP